VKIPREGRNLKEKEKTVNGVLDAFNLVIDSLNSFTKKTQDVSFADLAIIQKERQQDLENAFKLNELQEENKQIREKLNLQDQIDKEKLLKESDRLTAECKEPQMKLLVEQNRTRDFDLQKKMLRT